MRKIIKLFKSGNVCVTGLRGRGKDMLLSNVVLRRKLPYVSNVDYGADYYAFNYSKIAVGNTYKNFITGHINRYVFPYPDKTDFYISDAGIYFPSQYCNELNKLYPDMPVFQALTRHLGDCNFHFNVQNLNRVWDKIREQSDIYILCRKCIYIPLLKIVIQKVTIYDRVESCLQRLKPFKLPIPLLATRQTKQQAKIAIATYEANHGSIKNRWLIYRNKSKYDTRLFKGVLSCEEKNT